MTTLRANTISRYLAQQGFERSRTIQGRIADGESRGFRVRANVLNGRVEIRYTDGDTGFYGESTSDVDRRCSKALSDMETVLSEHYTVTRDKDYSGRAYLVVAAKTAEEITEAPHAEPAKKPVKLGENQQFALLTLRDRNEGVWSPGCGWLWDNYSTTVRLLDSLVKRGMAEKTSAVAYKERYVITDAGRAYLAR